MSCPPASHLLMTCMLVVCKLKAISMALPLQTVVSPLQTESAVEDRFEPVTPTSARESEVTSRAQTGLDQPDFTHLSNSQSDSRSTALPSANSSGSVPSSISTHNKQDYVSSSEIPEMFSTSSKPNITTFQGHVVLGTHFFFQCFKSGGHVKYQALGLEMLVRYDEENYISADYKKSHLQCHVDLVVPDDRVVQIQVVNLTSDCHGQMGRLHIVESQRLDTLVDVCKSTVIAGEFSLSSRVSVKVSVDRPGKNWDSPFSLHLILTAVAPAHQLEVHFLNDTKGFVQTPRWDGKVHYPHSMNSRVWVKVPDHHDVMLSFYSVQMGFYMNCDEDYVRVFKNAISQGKIIGVTVVHKLCGDYTIPPPQRYAAIGLVFMFKSNSRAQHPGFRALFSFHHVSCPPQQSADGLWNCSVPEWPQFSQHFPCNLESDCLHSEDEVDCDYVTAECGRGVISAGQGCYVLDNLGTAKRHYGAMKESCRARGGVLANLNTVQEWRDVWHVLRQGRWKKLMLGLQPAPSLWPHMYRESYHWEDGSVAYYMELYRIPRGVMCSYLLREWRMFALVAGECDYNAIDLHVLCELDKPQALPSATPIQLPLSTNHPGHGAHVRCPSGHVIHNFLACDVHSKCWADSASPSASCQPPVTSLPPPVFACSDGGINVPYTLVCDHRRDCYDNSDEVFCFFPPCRNEEFRCANGQCISAKICDEQAHCLDNSQDHACYREHKRERVTRPPPGIVDMDQHGKLQVTTVSPSRLPDGSLSCPETHFQCAMDNYYCLPVYLRCNDVYDCPNREDELGCFNYTCSGFYRCRSSTICVHPDHLCDHLYQCPQRDDELTCDLYCPNNCTCHGLAFTCTAPFNANEVEDLRYLDARGTLMRLSDLKNHAMLIYLNLAQCNLTRLPHVTFPNLHHLDLSGNLIRTLHSIHLTESPNMKKLHLSGNPLSLIFPAIPADSTSNLQNLDLSNTRLFYLDTSNLTLFSELYFLNLSGSGVDRISERGLRPFSQLRVVDVRGCSMSQFPRGLMENLERLRSVFADNYKLCCPAVLPAGFPLADCHAQSDEISSCDTLLRSDIFRLFLYFYATLALVGNAGSFIYRIVISKAECNKGFIIFVAHLCVSDFLMGLYLAAIGIADRLYQGSYLWEDVAWRNSVVCKMAGFLSLLSCEVSTFIICLITVDRFLVLRFPFSHFHFRKRSAQTACLSSWLVGLVLALLPLVPPTSHWQFYKQTSICLPLPVTRQYFKGRAYSFGVMVILNFILFLLIAVGQAFIYQAIRMNSISLADSSKSSCREVTIARRLISVAMSDFVCWFPIGCLGLLASQDLAIPGDVSVGLAIFVLPLNSALNPFLYTLNVIREKRRQAYFKRLQALIHSQQQAKATDMSFNR